MSLCVDAVTSISWSRAGASMHDANAFGWKVGKPEHDWEAMVETVQNHVKMLNFRYRVGLKSANVR